ncbi:hypothetical protein MNBD_UNCLBAC01-1894 [hydrothermal vent metagenome]|uniref:Toxin HicA n=1 Tax=hydrothermal vent metagenome TaxID=652676 RepID=A0A3B1DKL6_9ZZZZ
MGKHAKLIIKILSGQSDYNIEFKDIVFFLLAKGFNQRTQGSHLVFTKKTVDERINLQPDGSKAKGYQVKQIRKILIKYGENL